MSKVSGLSFVALATGLGLVGVSQVNALPSQPTSRGIQLADVGGAIGCLPPSVSGRQRAIMRSLGAVPCDEKPARPTDTSATSSPRPTDWSIDPTAGKAVVRSRESADVFLILSCDDVDGVTPEIALGLVTGSRAFPVRYLRQAIKLQVQANGKQPYAFATSLGAASFGGSSIGGKSVDHSGGSIKPADLRALKRATSITVTAQGQAFTFPVARSASTIAKLSCGNA